MIHANRIISIFDAHLKASRFKLLTRVLVAGHWQAGPHQVRSRLLGEHTPIRSPSATSTAFKSAAAALPMRHARAHTVLNAQESGSRMITALPSSRGAARAPLSSSRDPTELWPGSRRTAATMCSSRSHSLGRARHCYRLTSRAAKLRVRCSRTRSAASCVNLDQTLSLRRREPFRSITARHSISV
eukprot:6189593-Pleurochrysis_carterae.AAC.2